MEEEIRALEQNGTWELVDLPPSKKPIGCRWVYKIKHKADGTIERYKARLVAKGYNQVLGIDYLDTFSPVAKVTTIRTLLAVAAAKGWHLHQMDVSNAFLHGDLDEEVYMQLPPGLSGKRNGEFTKGEGDSFVALLVYVDDILVASTDLGIIQDIKNQLNSSFKIKDLGPLKYFLGLEVARQNKGMAICQRKYALELLKDTGFTDCKPVHSPIVPSHKLNKLGGKPIEDNTQYRKIVGKLLYLTITRPDICFATQQLSQFLDCPTDLHMQAAHRVLRYIKGAPGQGLLFPAVSDLKMKAFSDSDWGACVDTRRSIIGLCVFIGNALVSWKSKKQVTVSKSSSEAEYRALVATTCEVQWLSYLLTELGIDHNGPTAIYCDSKSAIAIAENPVFHERTKHIELDCHLIREKLNKGVIKLFHVGSE
ncbi:PREDICTED: uncharacterized protein LOC109176759 [Ipomoea nil]|uniref:uncharacterized protein LOC109176759 n=1 Tax=Ipomoea nil TaxID=35883 RepID=UPI000901F49A|nr:PREDICTED: uncharacterized protein LOC109176759 [Ipomoea nil]